MLANRVLLLGRHPATQQEIFAKVLSSVIAKPVDDAVVRR